MFTQNKNIIFYKTKQSYIDFVIEQFKSPLFKDSSPEILIAKTKDEFEKSLGLKIKNTPKFFYNFLNFFKLNYNCEIYDFEKIPKDDFIDSLFETDISLNINKNDEPKRIYSGGYKSTYQIESEEKYLFLDRDGVINYDCHYPSSVDDIVFFNEIISIIKQFTKLNYKVVVISNQSGVARGKLNLSNLQEIETYLNHKFKEQDVDIFKWIYCPFHIQGTISKYSKKSYTRKPYPGMILDLMHTQKIDLLNSIMIGDKASDHLNILHLKTYLIKGNYEINYNSEMIFNSHKDLNIFFKHLL